MLSFIRESLQYTNKYIILATPLILFSLISSLYILFSINGSILSLVIALVLFMLMFAAFLSGWGYMIKICVLQQSDEDENALIKEFPAGVGEYFLPVVVSLFVLFVFSSFLLAATYYVGMKFIGNLGIPADVLARAFESSMSLRTFLFSLSEEQLIKLNVWKLLLLVGMGLEYYLIMFYFPALFFKSKNPFKAFFVSLKDLFSRYFFNNLILFIFLATSYCILSFITIVFNINIFMHFILMLINFYYIVAIAVLIADYYYKKFVKIGGNLDKRI